MDKIKIHIDPDLADLIPGFLKNRQSDILAIRVALECSDFETVRLAGHSMKGSGAGYGFDGISQIGKAIEDAAKAGNAAEVKKQISELQSYLNRLEIIYG